MKNKNMPFILLFAATTVNGLAELQQERAQKFDAQEKLIADRKKSDSKVFTEDQKRKFNDLQTEIDDLDSKIEEERAVIAAEKRAAENKGTTISAPVDMSTSDSEAKERAKVLSKASVNRALRLSSQRKAIDGAEAEMSAIGLEENRIAEVKEEREADFYIPMSMLRADAFTATEDSGNFGGETIVKQAPQLQMPFGANPIMADLGATIWSGLTGGSIPLPVGGKSAFSWLTETEETPIGKSAINGPELSPNRLGRTEDISNRLILQSSVNIEGFVRSEIIKAYYRAIDAAAVNGSGVAPEPTGILNTAGVQTSTVSVATKPTRALVNELTGLLSNEDVSEEALAYLMTPALRTLLHDTKTDAGSGIFVMNKRDQLADYKAVASTLVPKVGGNEVLIFGDFAKLFIGMWGSLGVLTDPYSASRKNCLRITVNGHAGTAIAQPKAFAVNKFLNATGA